ncbi:PucR family transcriptional regulator [Rhodococcus sp. C-2]|uniref:PucR family transcriptional regulator n=1 Tax=Rhodococcus sp. C-2 TaxID=3018809 RepID=UPI0022EB8768|nr:helix-turn-helix domain-containing protein [Rhodococcus sp. C-2]MDA3637682.1 helix-turn-helix domain-containing protein [Rhodococcus sp. C-2]
MNDDEMIQRWRTLVSERYDELEILTDRFVVRVLRDPLYARIVDVGDLRETSRQTFAFMLDALIDVEAITKIESIAGNLGRRRARQGIPLENLVDAVRLDFPVLWSTLLERADKDDFAVIAAHAERVWNVVDTFARLAQTSYLAEQAELARERQDLQRQYISLLFEAVGQFEVNFVQIAQALGVPRDAYFRVVAVPRLAGADLRRNADRAAAGGRRMFLHELGRHMIGFWQIERGATQALTAQERRLLASLPVAVAPIAREIADIPLAALAATEIADQLGISGDSIVDLKDAWPQLAKRKLSEIGCDLQQFVLVPIRSCKESERDRLIETMMVYLRTGGLIETAAALYCHRNTILNRLKRIEELTGLDMTKPLDAALATVALAELT